MRIPRRTSEEAKVARAIAYGQVPGLEDSGPNEQRPAAPNETVEMAVGRRTDVGHPDFVTMARLKVGMIIFADGTAWRNGFNLIRHPNNPRHYIRVGKS